MLGYVHSHHWLNTSQYYKRSVWLLDVGNAQPRAGGNGRSYWFTEVVEHKAAKAWVNGYRYGVFDLEDMQGLVRSICWPEVR